MNLQSLTPEAERAEDFFEVLLDARRGRGRAFVRLSRTKGRAVKDAWFGFDLPDRPLVQSTPIRARHEFGAADDFELD